MRVLAGVLAFSLATAGHASAAPRNFDPARIPAGVYELDPRHASLIAKAPHLGGFSRYTMRFDKLSGDFTIDPANWRKAVVSIHVAAASVDTGDRNFDRQIAGYFGAAKHPDIIFVSRSLDLIDARSGKLTGDLNFNGVTRPVTLDVTFNGSGPGLPGEGTRLGFSGSGRVKRSEFGVSAASNWAGDDVDLLFEVEFVRRQ
jgi:polyisoprenoid-binding protein YceI